jgi:hypothetical protein
MFVLLVCLCFLLVTVVVQRISYARMYSWKRREIGDKWDSQ